MEYMANIVLLLIFSAPILMILYHMTGETLWELIGWVVRKIYKLPDYTKCAGAFTMLGLMASTASRRQVLESGLRILKSMEKHRWAYPRSHMERVFELLDYAEWAVIHRDRMAAQDKEEYARTERARQRQHKQGNPSKNPSSSAQAWRSTLGLSSGERDIQAIKQAYRKLAQRAHPDRGGSNDAMVRLNLAMQQARAELRFT